MFHNIVTVYYSFFSLFLYDTDIVIKCSVWLSIIQQVSFRPALLWSSCEWIDLKPGAKRRSGSFNNWRITGSNPWMRSFLHSRLLNPLRRLSVAPRSGDFLSSGGAALILPTTLDGCCCCCCFSSYQASWNPETTGGEADNFPLMLWASAPKSDTQWTLKCHRCRWSVIRWSLTVMPRPPLFGDVSSSKFHLGLDDNSVTIHIDR